MKYSHFKLLDGARGRRGALSLVVVDAELPRETSHYHDHVDNLVRAHTKVSLHLSLYYRLWCELCYRQRLALPEWREVLT